MNIYNSTFFGVGLAWHCRRHGGLFTGVTLTFPVPMIVMDPRQGPAQRLVSSLRIGFLFFSLELFLRSPKLDDEGKVWTRDRVGTVGTAAVALVIAAAIFALMLHG